MRLPSSNGSTCTGGYQWQGARVRRAVFPGAPSQDFTHSIELYKDQDTAYTWRGRSHYALASVRNTARFKLIIQNAAQQAGEMTKP